MEYIIGIIFIALIAFFFLNKKKLDLNQDGKVDSADAKEAVVKVEAEVVKLEEAVVAEIKEVVKKVRKPRATPAAKKPAAKKVAAKKAVVKKPTTLKKA